MGQEPDKDVMRAASGDRVRRVEPPEADPNLQVEMLKVDIEQTRSDIGETLQALEERLTPGNLASDAATAVKDKASRTMEQVMTNASERMSDVADKTREAAQTVAETVRDNPWPAVLVGAGLGYLLYRTFGERRHDWEASWNNRAYEYDQPLEESYGSYGSYGEERRTLVRRAADKVGRQASSLGRQASSAMSRTGRMVRDNPLGFGIAAMAVGAAVGLSAPATETENEWLGETRDKVVDRAREAAGLQSEPDSPDNR